MTATCVLVASAGCGLAGSTTAPPLPISGEVDTAAPPAAQKKQLALKRLLDAIHEGATDKGSLRLHAANVDFQETEVRFLDGHAWLARWNFDGPVEGDTVPVALYFSDREFHYGDPERHVLSKRKYTVVETRSKYSIARAKEVP